MGQRIAGRFYHQSPLPTTRLRQDDRFGRRGFRQQKKAPHMDGRAHAVAQNTKNAHTWACGGSHRRQTMAAPVLRSRAPSGRRSVPALRTASPGAGSGSPLPPQWSPAPAPVHRGADVWSSGWAACRRDTSAPLPTWLVPSRSPPALYETLNQYYVFSHTSLLGTAHADRCRPNPALIGITAEQGNRKLDHNVGPDRIRASTPWLAPV